MRDHQPLTVQWLCFMSIKINIYVYKYYEINYKMYFHNKLILELNVKIIYKKLSQT